jgi:RNA polymerase sigma factor (sigma-70 family)
MEHAETNTPMNAVEPIPPHPGVEPADAVLLQGFVSRRDEAAFAMLVERHGPLVLSACMRILNHRQDAEDAFQTTFLVLARKASSITRRQALSSWLYRVAFRIALKARSARARRVMSESNLDDVPAPEDAPAWIWRDLQPILDEEVNRLPLKYRLPFILCYLQGKTYGQAAVVLNCPPGTVMSRLAKARERLRSRLALRGVTLSTGALAVVLGQQASAASLPAALARPTVANALRFVTGQAGQVAVHLARPAEEFLRAMFRSRLLWIGAYSLILLGIAGLSIWLGLASIGSERGKAVKPQPLAVAADDQTRMQGIWLPERVEIGGQVPPSAGLRVSITGDSFKLFSLEGGNPFPLLFLLDATAQPPAIDLYDPDNANLSFRGIYRLDGDTLMICYSRYPEERPKAFDSSISPLTLLYQLKRDTSADR